MKTNGKSLKGGFLYLDENMMQQLIKKMAAAMGFQIQKAPKTDYRLSLYQDYYPMESLKERRFYNIGAGSFYHPYWTNVDHISAWYAANTEHTLKGINYDLFELKPLPVADHSAELIYTSHTLEHVNNEAVQNVLNESYRILKKGGRIRIITPDINLSYRAYQDNDRSFFFWIDWYSSEKDYKRVNIRKPLNQESTAQIFLEDFASQASEIPLHGNAKRISDGELAQLFSEKSLEEALNYCTSLCEVEIQKQHPGNHINWFNENKLRTMLQTAGFSNIYRSAYGQSYAPVMRDLNFFDKTLPAISLYMEAEK